MNCPHCRGEIPAYRPVRESDRCRLYGHHGEMDLDSRQLRSLVANAMEYARMRRRMAQALSALELYREVAERMSFDPDFASHVLSYDGQGGWRWFPGATRAAKIAELKARLARGESRENDLSYYLDLAWKN